MDIASINWLAVPVAALSAFVLGGIWYGPIFGKAWQRLSGVTDEQIQNANPAVIYGGAFVLNLVMATSLSLLLQLHPTPALGSGIAVGTLLGLTLIAASMGINYLFARKPLQLWLVDAGYMVLLMAVMGAILGAWR
jgi:L-cystine uptake protein TcyP (sodium:dicarboxylate symporter family)